MTRLILSTRWTLALLGLLALGSGALWAQSGSWPAPWSRGRPPVRSAVAEVSINRTTSTSPAQPQSGGLEVYYRTNAQGQWTHHSSHITPDSAREAVDYLRRAGYEAVAR